ncbi:MAG: LPP20 family lipoprotein [Thalassotalea sp.]
MKKTVTILLMSLCFLLSACSTMYDKQVQWQRIKPESFPVLHAIGHAPISLQNSENETQKMLMAITASKVAAYVELAEQVYGQQIDNNLTMADLLVSDQTMKTKVQGIIRGARVMKSYPVGDIYTTELKLDFKDVYEIYAAMNVEKEIKDVRYF